jgi:hypothetical protein
MLGLRRAAEVSILMDSKGMSQRLESREIPIWMGELKLVPSKQRLLNCKLAARAPDHFLRFGILQELESEAKSTPLPNRRENFDVPEWKAEFEPKHLALGRLFAKYGGDSRFADVDRVTLDYAQIAGVDIDRHLQLEARMSPVFDRPWR